MLRAHVSGHSLMVVGHTPTIHWNMRLDPEGCNIEEYLGQRPTPLLLSALHRCHAVLLGGHVPTSESCSQDTYTLPCISPTYLLSLLRAAFLRQPTAANMQAASLSEHR